MREMSVSAASAVPPDAPRCDPPFASADLARRHAAARRLAWLIGGAALLLYIAGLFIPR